MQEQKNDGPLNAILALIDDRLRQLEVVQGILHETPYALGRPIAPLNRWQEMTCQQLADAGLRSEAHRLARQGYMGSGDPVLDVIPRISAYGTFLVDLRRQVQQDPSIISTQQNEEPRMVKDPRHVAVVHGRNQKARDGIFEFLRALDLKPGSWHYAIKQTGKGSPHAREVLDALFSTTQAVVVLLTADEDAVLHPHLRSQPGDDATRAQARPNVWIEAGMALGVNPDRTILVRFANHIEPSDIQGLQYVPFDGSPAARIELRERLEAARCPVSTAHDEWLRAGQAHFDAVLRAPAPESSRRRRSWFSNALLGLCLVGAATAGGWRYAASGDSLSASCAWSHQANTTDAPRSLACTLKNSGADLIEGTVIELPFLCSAASLDGAEASRFFDERVFRDDARPPAPFTIGVIGAGRTRSAVFVPLPKSPPATAWCDPSAYLLRAGRREGPVEIAGCSSLKSL